MHRLLSYKGYVFPEVRREDAAVLNPSDVRGLRTLHEGDADMDRIYDRPRKWRRRRRRPSPLNCKN